MAYTKKVWQDRIKDSSGNVIQEGTPFSAGNMNRIEQGIADAHAALGTANRQTQTLTHGLQVLNGDVDAPVSIQIEGCTLVPMQNNVLDASKYYVLADKKTKLKWADGTYTQGIAKFTGKAEQPTLVHISNFENKISGSTLENPHLFRWVSDDVSTSLVFPTNTSKIGELSQDQYNDIKSLDGRVNPKTITATGAMAQRIFSFDIIQAIERKLGKIPRSTLADKVAWVQANIASLSFNWYGYGSSPNGNKATIKAWYASGSKWSDDVWTGQTNSHTNATVTKLTSVVDGSHYIDFNGFAHFLSYANASDGTTASTINTDYVELEIEFAAGVVLHQPRVPLYEVSQNDYNHILVDWLDDEVAKRYPPVEGVQHVQNPYVMAEGDNLIPPFSEWTFINPSVKINGPYDLEINTTASDQYSYVNIPLLPNTTYRYKGEILEGISERDMPFRIYLYDKNEKLLNTTPYYYNFTTPANVSYANVRITNAGLTGVKVALRNPMLTLGTADKPFVPRNPSYLFAETKLGNIGSTYDRFYEQDGKYYVRKAIEKDVLLDGTRKWLHSNNFSGFKVFMIVPLSPGTPLINNQGYLTKYNGIECINRQTFINASNYNRGDLWQLGDNGGVNFYVSVSNADTGFADTYTPTTDEIKAYFNGWKVKTADTNGKPTAWISLFDGSDAPTQTLTYVSTTRADGFTPYRLSYQLATPQVLEAKVEGSISVNGLTQVELGSGVVIREKANYVFDTNDNMYKLNLIYSAGSATRYKVDRFLSLYKNNIDQKANFRTDPRFSNGKQYHVINANDYDPTAEYYVTYIIYDRNQFTANILNAIATYANNIRTALDDTVKKVEDNTTAITVNTNILYDVLKRLKAGGL